MIDKVKIKSMIFKYFNHQLLNELRRCRGALDKMQNKYHAHLNTCDPSKISKVFKYNGINGVDNTELVKQIDRSIFTDYENLVVEWGLAFGEYNRPDDKGYVSLMWADRPSPGNFGDWLSPYIFAKLTSMPIRFIDPLSRNPSKHFVGIGSLAPSIKKTSIVLGAGTAKIGMKINPHAKYISLRGPYSAEELIKSGGPKVEKFGDLGFICSRLYTPKSEKIPHKKLFVRHVNHLNLDIQIDDGIEELKIYSSSIKSIEEFIDNIYSAEQVITSAMHCFITCQSYNIPCALVNFKKGSNAVWGDGVKYLDCLAGVGLPEIKPYLLENKISIADFDFLNFPKNITDEKINDIYSHAKSNVTKIIQDTFIKRI